jgi:hypothetical protein
MSALEQEIIEKFHQLQPAAKRRVRAVIDQEVILESETVSAAEFDYAGWVRNIEALREEIRRTRGDTLPPTDVVGLLRDLRDGEDE